jgi:hypothetical protein
VEDGAPVKVGVVLELDAARIGEWLADAAAFDAGGVDSLWLEPGPELDVLAVAAALAVVTFRARLVVPLPETSAARTLDTVGRLSRGRLALVAEPDRRADLPTDLSVFRRVSGEPGVFEDLSAEARERWLSIPVPEGRASWREARAEAAASGARGLLVPADPRLLDVLRNPDDPGERHDLQLAQG